MAIISAIIGLVVGFVIGQIILLQLLRGRTKKELLTDKNLQMKYGLFNWLIAGVCAYLTYFAYNLVFTP